MVSKPARLPSGVRLSGITAGCLPLTPEFFNEGQANCKAVRYIALRLFLCFECLNDLFTKVLGVGFHSPLPCLMFTVHATATRSKLRFMQQSPFEYMESVPAKADLSIPLSTQITWKYFSDFYISYCRGSLSMATAFGLKATKG